MTSGTGKPRGWRGPPAFQMYAPDRLADRNFKTLSLAERGLVHTIELECWVNRCVPADTRELARTLGLEYAEVEMALTPRVWRYFERREQPEPVLVCPDLEQYREMLDARHASMSTGGRKGAETRWRGKRQHSEDYRDLNGNPNNPREERKGEEQKGVRKREGKDDEFIEQLAGEPDFMQEAEQR